jgi:hypothetical protein
MEETRVGLRVRILGQSKTDGFGYRVLEMCCHLWHRVPTLKQIGAFAKHTELYVTTVPTVYKDP